MRPSDLDATACHPGGRGSSPALHPAFASAAAKASTSIRSSALAARNFASGPTANEPSARRTTPLPSARAAASRPSTCTSPVAGSIVTCRGADHRFKTRENFESEYSTAVSARAPSLRFGAAAVGRTHAFSPVESL